MRTSHLGSTLSFYDKLYKSSIYRQNKSIFDKLNNHYQSLINEQKLDPSALMYSQSLFITKFLKKYNYPFQLINKNFDMNSILERRAGMYHTMFRSNNSYAKFFDLQKYISEISYQDLSEALGNYNNTVINKETTLVIQTQVNNYFVQNIVQNESTKDESNQKNLFIQFIINFLICTIINQYQMAAFEYGTKVLISEATTASQILQISKNEIKQNDLIELYGQRIALSNINLREAPNQQSQIIDVVGRAKLLSIIDEPGLHKAWLKVEIDSHGEKVQGYILRRYTANIKP